MNTPTSAIRHQPLHTVAVPLRHGHTRAAPQQEEAAEPDLVVSVARDGVLARRRDPVLSPTREQFDGDGAGRMRRLSPTLQLQSKLHKARVQHGTHLGVCEHPLVQPLKQRQRPVVGLHITCVRGLATSRPP